MSAPAGPLDVLAVIDKLADDLFELVAEIADELTGRIANLRHEIASARPGTDNGRAT